MIELKGCMNDECLSKCFVSLSGNTLGVPNKMSPECRRACWHLYHLCLIIFLNKWSVIAYWLFQLSVVNTSNCVWMSHTSPSRLTLLSFLALLPGRCSVAPLASVANSSCVVKDSQRERSRLTNESSNERPDEQMHLCHPQDPGQTARRSTMLPVKVASSPSGPSLCR